MAEDFINFIRHKSYVSEKLKQNLFCRCLNSECENSKQIKITTLKHKITFKIHGLVVVLSHLRCYFLSDKGSISPTCFFEAFTHAEKKRKNLCLFALLGSMRIKAACKTLVKLTQGEVSFSREKRQNLFRG